MVQENTPGELFMAVTSLGGPKKGQILKNAQVYS